uniref:Inosine/uridine-preferring nucleoside hydrolase domain-containing protein n=1 Tax=Timema monikensis TaxID=170555 RepID=A0A7R9ECZ6_9NEOP|nr:unnamed protein product [Timema monikensis]
MCTTRWSGPRLVIDTDVGTDDALALILCIAAERRGDAEILGVTCVHGNTDLPNVCVNTLKMLHTLRRLDSSYRPPEDRIVAIHCSREISAGPLLFNFNQDGQNISCGLTISRSLPVYRGASESIVRTFKRAPEIHGSDGFGDFDYPDTPDVASHLQQEHAVNFLTRITRENPGELTVLSLGPMTNIALAIRMDPNFCNNVKHIIIMGGNSEGIGNVTAGAEFNFYCDPEAAHICLHNMKCPITIFPWETAFNHCRLSYLAQRLKSEETNIVGTRNRTTREIPEALKTSKTPLYDTTVLKEWRINILGGIKSPQAELMTKIERPMLEQKRYGFWARCDPIAAAIAVNPQMATVVSERYATVELHGSATRGALVIDHLNKMDREPNVTIVTRVDVELYKSMLLEAFVFDFSKK